jgi:hypothetical protein
MGCVGSLGPHWIQPSSLSGCRPVCENPPLSQLPYPTELMRKCPQLLALALLSASAAQAQQAVAPLSVAEVIETYWIDSDALKSFYSLPGSELRRERLARLDEQTLERLEKMDFEAFGVAEAVDWHLLGLHLAHARALRARKASQRGQAARLLGFQPAIDSLERERWSLTATPPRAAARRVAEIAAAVEDILERVAKPAPLSPEPAAADELPVAEAEAEALEVSAPEALRVAGWIDSSRKTLTTWYDHHADFDPEFRWWLEKPYKRTKLALEELALKLRKDLAGQAGEDDDPLVGQPIGRAALCEDLASQFLSFTPEELLAIGTAEYAWCDEQLALCAAELGHGSDWRAALEEVKEAFSPPGEQDRLVAHQAREMILWLDERDLVTIPDLARETWRVAMIGKQGQRHLPFAAYGGQKMLVAYATADMTHDEKLSSLRGNNEHFTRCVTPHELIPGHHLQGFMASRHARHRRRFSTPFLVEGWALYWEMLEWDLGWARGPADRLGMLFWRKHRAARIGVSLGFHLGQMTPEEMIELLVEGVGHERQNAVAEVRRYIGEGYSPLYQCGYMIGGLQLRALAQELIQSGQMSPREFHDAVLRQNSIPIELLRAALTGRKPARDAQPRWRADLVPD